MADYLLTGEMYFSKQLKKLFILLSLLMSFGISVSGLGCYSCSDSSFDGEPSNIGSCYNIGESITATGTCSYSDSYCQTKFVFQDGIATSVQRSCTGGQSDHDSSTTSMPVANKCETTLRTYSNPIDSTTCYYHCNSTNNCNDVTLSTLKACGTDCGRGYGRGYCNYISGNCVCSDGWTGSDCSISFSTTASYSGRKCVQCNSETDRGCKTKTDGAFCPSSQRYCSSTQTSIFKAGAVVRTILIRGCTTSHIAVDECKITDIYSDSGINNQGYYEYTCYSTCDTDNCNTNTPNGLIDGEEKTLLKCYQCASSSGFCSTGPSFCPRGSTHCKTTVNYMISDKVDTRYRVDVPGSYKLISFVSECATAAVKAECTESEIGDLTLKNVTCQETCQGDGCNDKWPTRPKCIQCSGDSTTSCFKSPGFAWRCSYPHEKYCVIKDSGLEEGTRATLDGYPRHIERGCSYVDIGTSCKKTIIRDKGIQSCNYTCTTDGCNVGSGSESFRRISQLTFAFCILFMAWVFA